MVLTGAGGLMRVTLTAALLILLALTGCGGGEAEGEKQAVATADSTAADSTATDSTATDSARAAQEGGEKKDEKKKKVLEGVPVKVSPVAQGRISSHLLYSTTVETEETVDVYARTAGLVRRVLAEEGDWVEAGQVLVELVDDDMKLAEAESSVNYRKLESQFQRKKEMFSRELVAKEDYERQKFDLEQARIGWERSKLALAHASVQSPAKGVVAERLVKLGDRIGPSNKLFGLVDMENLIARVHVPGREAGRLEVGQPAKLTTDFLPDSTFTGQIKRISPVVDPGSGTFKVTLEVLNRGHKLKPGMFANAHIVTETHEAAVLVPKRAVVYDDGLPHVFVVEDSTATRVQLTVAEGFQDSEHIEVLSGVTKGEKIVVVGQSGLKDRAKIRIIEGEGLRIPAKVDTTKQKDEPS